MQSIEEFMQSYFAEWTTLNHAQEINSGTFRANFFSADYLYKLRDEWNEHAVYRREHPPIILSIENHGNTAEVIASQPSWYQHEHRRYHLRNTEIGRKIERKASRCSFCANITLHGQKSCFYCDDVKWLYYGTSKR